MEALATKAVRSNRRGTRSPILRGPAVDYLGQNLQKLMDGHMTPDDVISKSTADITRATSSTGLRVTAE